jgi:hypothetical protein
MDEGMTVLALDTWKTNGHLIADVARLGYLEGHVLDPTFGKGTFWKIWQPARLTSHDLKLDGVDFADLPYGDEAFDAVVLDPPYKLNGTPDVALDERYGVETPTSWQDRMALIEEGVAECSRVARSFLLVKCQDQVCSGAMRWQTDLVTEKAQRCDFVKVDRFDMGGHHRPQPMDGREQKHAHGRPSTLLVFRK